MLCEVHGLVKYDTKVSETGLYNKTQKPNTLSHLRGYATWPNDEDLSLIWV